MIVMKNIKKQNHNEETVLRQTQLLILILFTAKRNKKSIEIIKMHFSD